MYEIHFDKLSNFRVMHVSGITIKNDKVIMELSCVRSMSEDNQQKCCPILFERAGTDWWNPR